MSKEITEYKASPVENIKKLLGSGLKVAELKEYMEMQLTWEKREAEKAFHVAMAEFKKNPPKILKSKKVTYKTSSGETSYSHAELGEITEAIGKSLSLHGLNATWETEQENSIKVTCTITHEDGHSQSTSLSSPPDNSGGKNSIQAIGSTITYLQRYTLLALTGLAATGQDNDGNNGDNDQNIKIPTLTDKIMEDPRFSEFWDGEIQEGKIFVGQTLYQCTEEQIEALEKHPKRSK